VAHFAPRWRSISKRAWNARVEGFISKGSPFLNSTLLVLGFYLAMSSLLAHLSWYGLPRSPLSPAWDWERLLIKLAVFFGILGLVKIATPGSRSRRLFGALAFPFFAVFIVLSMWTASHLIGALVRTTPGSLVDTLVRGPVVGVAVAAVISSATLLVYRGVAAPIGILALLPSVAKASSTIGTLDLQHLESFLSGPLWPLCCCALAVVVFTLLWRPESTPRFG